jgi:hypothetical protein
MKYIALICLAFTLVSCGTPRYQLPSHCWYSAQNHASLTMWIKHWEAVLQEENRKCYYNYPHNHEYHSYVKEHLRMLYIYRGHMELQFRNCNYY